MKEGTTHKQRTCERPVSLGHGEQSHCSGSIQVTITEDNPITMNGCFRSIYSGKLSFLKSGIVLLIFIFVTACSGGNSDDTGSNGTSDTSGTSAGSGIRVLGSFSGMSGASLNAVLKTIVRADFNDDPSLCPDETGGGVSASTTPTNYIVALKKLTLLGDTGTTDYVLFEAEDAEEAYVVDFLNDDVTFFSSDDYPDPGTYNGFEIEVFYIEMEIPMIIPAISDTEENYNTRGYFDTVGNCVKRDVTVFYDSDEDGTEEEYWIDRKNDSPTAFELISVENSHPDQVLDLWADEDFWDRDPVTISTDDTSYGTDFRFELADGSSGLTISESTSGLYTVTLNFDVSFTFTFWEYLETGDSAEADGTFMVGFDCGYRIMFPNVVISVESDEGTE
ncbi:MAG: hypothetical protein SVY10_07780 [Thermodesulfobacteriota bacterium]|nr:hypothetical protein [Thermodesulfobacteriota bacterium]